MSDLITISPLVSAYVIHAARALVLDAHDVPNDERRGPTGTALAFHEAVAESVVAHADGSPISAPKETGALVRVEVLVTEREWYWLEWSAFRSGLTLEQACAAVLEEFIWRDCAPGLDCHVRAA